MLSLLLDNLDCLAVRELHDVQTLLCGLDLLASGVVDASNLNVLTVLDAVDGCSALTKWMVMEGIGFSRSSSSMYLNDSIPHMFLLML